PNPTHDSSPASDQLRPTANELNKPINKDATRDPSREPNPPTTTTTNTITPSSIAMLGLVGKNAPATAPASPANAAPVPKTPMKTKGTLCPRDSAMTGSRSAARTTRPARVRDRSK